MDSLSLIPIASLRGKMILFKITVVLFLSVVLEIFLILLLGKTFGKNFWEKLLGKTFGKNFWEKLLGKTFGKNFWEKLLNKTRFVK